MYERSQSRSDVQTLSHQLEAARHNSDYLQEHSCTIGSSLLNSRSIFRKLNNLLTKRESAHWDRQVLRLKTKMRKTQAIGGDDAAS